MPAALVLAFVMCTHGRLGAASPAHALVPDVVSRIMACVWSWPAAVDAASEGVRLLLGALRVLLLRLLPCDGWRVW